MALSVRLSALVALSLTLSTEAFAASTIMVKEDGEAGGPMTISLDHASVPAGDVIFKVHNDALSEEHEMVLVKLKSADETVPVNAAKHRVDESKLKSLGEVADLKAGKDGQLKVKLAPGNYLLLCNIKGHFEAGMKAKLTVTP
ncbi:putative cupredoxin-like copper-binding protein [Neorhizobium galegae]|uniref:plastocyanin/azurin family copper-binding protein n=1 Tax=Rhizobium/Agrobacterium group TaxID=227290 RepID=UPI001AE4FBB5|nr:plastocyanin/azurin family copper-binding protein [Neorhizobium galegae]MBP2549459.1 putative cupredoxin-like copper-binding protein [Neorhizobium galegae]